MGLTLGGGEECGGEGDYLAWRDMEWQLKGEAEVTHIEEQLPCGGQDLDTTLQCPTGQVVFLSPHYLVLKKQKSLYFFLKLWNHRTLFVRLSSEYRRPSLLGPRSRVSLW